METKANFWTRHQALEVLELYLSQPFGHNHARNPRVAALANAIGRTPGAVAMKLGNFAHLDPHLARRGLDGVAKQDRAIWRTYLHAPAALFAELETARAAPPGFAEPHPARLSPAHLKPAPDIDTDAPVSAIARRGQTWFRQNALIRFSYRCAVTGLDDERLLTASHIVPWAEDRARRLDPSNGIALNALHDRAFDKGLITFDENWRVMVSPRLAPEARSWFAQPAFAALRMPDHVLPDPAAMARHRGRFAANFT